METSAQELLAAIQSLCGQPETDNSGNMLGAYAWATGIAESFSNVNTNLCNGWQGTADFFERLRQQLVTRLEGLYNVLQGFSVDTIDAELAAATASENANSAAADILAELEATLSNNTDISLTGGYTGDGTHSENSTSKPNDSSGKEPHEPSEEKKDVVQTTVESLPNGGQKTTEIKNDGTTIVTEEYPDRSGITTEYSADGRAVSGGAYSSF